MLSLFTVLSAVLFAVSPADDGACSDVRPFCVGQSAAACRSASDHMMSDAADVGVSMLSKCDQAADSSTVVGDGRKPKVCKLEDQFESEFVM